MSMASCPHPYDIMAWGVALLEPCNGMAKVGVANGYVSHDSVQAFDLQPQYEGGERLAKTASLGKICATKLLPKQYKNSTGTIGVCMIHPELRSMLNGGELYTNNLGYTTGGSGGGANGELVPVWLQVWEALDNGDCPDDLANVYDYVCHVYPYGYVMPVDGAMANKAYRPFTAQLDFQSLLPAAGYNGPFGDIPEDFFGSFTKVDWQYSFYTNNLPADSLCSLSTIPIGSGT